MKLIRGNIWKSGAMGICVTTNGIVKKNGDAVMGRGIALQAAQRYPELAPELGRRLTLWGNKVYTMIITFPTKHHWKDPSDIELIKNSAHQLVEAWQHEQRCALPFPGCANGGLRIPDVLSVIQPILSDDKFELWDYRVPK